MLSPDPDGSLDQEMPGVTGLSKKSMTYNRFDRQEFGDDADFSHEDQADLN